MDDPTNQYRSGAAMLERSLPPAAQPSGSSPTRPGNTSELPAWLQLARSLHPWQPLSRIAAGKTSPLLWGDGEVSVDAQQLLAKVQRTLQTGRWKAELAQPLETFLQPIEVGDAVSPNATRIALAFAYLLPALAQSKATLAQITLQKLIELSEANFPGATAADALAQLWLKLELPLVLAHFAPDAKTAVALRKGAAGAEARLANAWLDPFGLPTKEVGLLLRPWAATLVRSHELLRKTDTQFSEAARERLERLARHVLRLSRPDGSSILSTAHGSIADREFLTAVVLASTTAPPIAALALGKPAKEAKPVKGMPVPALYSPKSSLAVLRNRWAAPQTQLTIGFSGEQVWLDLSAGNQALLHGPWSAAISVSGERAEPIAPWSEVCWHSDADCDYLEIEQKLRGGWILQRHALLVRRDECLLLADSLLTETKSSPEQFLATSGQAPQLEYATEFPLAPAVAFMPQQDSREGHLIANRKPLALIMPLALPEWRRQPATGELSAAGPQLRHRLRAAGRNLFAPLWLDLNPARFKNAQCTWRQLTVGESLQVQPREVAVGYRVQVHYSQWLLYRSLAWRGNRTVLGKNFATDLACCRFQPNGETQDILEVQ